MHKKFVSDIKENDIVETPFLVVKKDVLKTKADKLYISMILRDSSGDIEARLWDEVEKFATSFAVDDFVIIKGRANSYQNRMQLSINDVQKLKDSDVNITDFLPTSHFNRDEMLQELKKILFSIKNSKIQSLVVKFFEDRDFLEKFKTAPAGKSAHHAYIGGLLEHTLSVCKLAKDVTKHYPFINADLLIFCAFLHDTGKVHELIYDKSFSYSDRGKLIGHLIIGVQMLDEKIAMLPNFPTDLKEILEHIILSHHGHYEFGSPKKPQTLEALILYFMDDLDAKVNGIYGQLHKDAAKDLNWSSYHKIYDQAIYTKFFDNSHAYGKINAPNNEEKKILDLFKDH